MDDLNPKTADALLPYEGYEQCGHCWETAAWKITSVMVTEAGAVWIDFECDKHARQWWPELF